MVFPVTFFPRIVRLPYFFVPSAPQIFGSGGGWGLRAAACRGPWTGYPPLRANFHREIVNIRGNYVDETVVMGAFLVEPRGLPAVEGLFRLMGGCGCGCVCARVCVLCCVCVCCVRLCCVYVCVLEIGAGCPWGGVKVAHST